MSTIISTPPDVVGSVSEWECLAKEAGNPFAITFMAGVTGGQMIHIRVLGLASIAADVSPQLALATVASVEVLGAFRAPTAVKVALAARIV